IPLYVTSATLPTLILSDVTDLLHLRPNNTNHIFRSNDCPNIANSVRKMCHAVDLFQDLNFLILNNFKDGNPLPSKFLIFFNSIREAKMATYYL
ncbi:hypothetical protein CERSUDRAFT_51607, partial [Gelatoporia subvermispora B]